MYKYKIEYSVNERRTQCRIIRKERINIYAADAFCVLEAELRQINTIVNLPQQTVKIISVEEIF